MEKLTDDEREFLMLNGIRRKALRIIDNLTAKCDAQTAVIERVRAVCASRPNDDDPEYRVLDDVEAALSAAPEQTAPLGSHAADLQALRATQELLDAANARIAELEAGHATLRVNNRVLEADNADLLERARAANARADAAERALGTLSDANESLKMQLEACRGVAESEAADLRAQLQAAKALFDASDADRRREWERAEKAERERDEARQQRGEWAEALNGKEGFRVRLQLAESEAADLRAEVARLRDKLNASQAESAARFARLSEALADAKCRHLLQLQAETQLAAANALLERVGGAWPIRFQMPERLKNDICAHLSGQAPARSASPPPKRL